MFYGHLIIRFAQQALYTYADKLQEVKADKEQVAMEMDVVSENVFVHFHVIVRFDVK